MSEDSFAKYNQDNKERLQKELVKNINFFLQKKKQQYGRERYKNISEDEKLKVIEYRKEY